MIAELILDHIFWRIIITLTVGGIMVPALIGATCQLFEPLILTSISVDNSIRIQPTALNNGSMYFSRCFSELV